MAVQIENLTKTYRQGPAEVHALRGVSCKMPAEEFTFIVGPSGSGKSTLLYLIGALEEPTDGRITVNGRSITRLTPKQRDQYRREQIGFVFQSFNLLSNLTALENVLVPFLPRGITPELRQRAASLLEWVGLGARLKHRPGQLSGGEQQRVAITRALLKQPALVLADEPTGELDSQNGAEVFGYLRQLSAEHSTTVIVATHDYRYITDTDQVLTLRDGQLDNGAPVH